jgi:hypothetical protein
MIRALSDDGSSVPVGRTALDAMTPPTLAYASRL